MAGERSTRDRLLDATVARVADGGVAAVSIGAVREDVGVSVGAVYHHFPDRQALLDAAWVRCLGSHQADLLGAVEGAQDARSGITGGVTAYLAWHGQHRAEQGQCQQARQPQHQTGFGTRDGPGLVPVVEGNRRGHGHCTQWLSSE